MWKISQETADLATFSEETLMENFIFCAVPWVIIVAKISVSGLLQLPRYSNLKSW